MNQRAENKTGSQPDRTDTKGIVRYLTFKFNSVTATKERAYRNPHLSGSDVGNETYYQEREFAYLLNEITQGPTCMIQRNIAACEDFISSI